MSPAYMRKIRNKNRYRVIDSKGKIHAKSTTKRKAEAQIRLLNNLRRKEMTYVMKDGSGKGVGRQGGGRRNINKGGCSKGGVGYGRGGGRGKGTGRKD